MNKKLIILLLIGILFISVVSSIGLGIVLYNKKSTSTPTSSEPTTPTSTPTSPEPTTPTSTPTSPEPTTPTSTPTSPEPTTPTSTPTSNIIYTKPNSDGSVLLASKNINGPFIPIFELIPFSTERLMVNNNTGARVYMRRNGLDSIDFIGENSGAVTYTSKWNASHPISQRVTWFKNFGYDWPGSIYTEQKI